MKMWHSNQQRQAMLWDEIDWREVRPVTARLARWWWRVHLAVPEVETWLDIHIWAEEFTRREMYEVLLGRPQDVSGVEAYLSYRPWAGPEAFAEYQSAIREGWIKDLPNSWSEGRLVEQLREQHGNRGDSLPFVTGLDGYFPDVLPSVQWMEDFEREKECMAFKRSGNVISMIEIVLDHGDGRQTTEEREL